MQIVKENVEDCGLGNGMWDGSKVKGKSKWQDKLLCWNRDEISNEEMIKMNYEIVSQIKELELQLQ